MNAFIKTFLFCGLIVGQGWTITHIHTENDEKKPIEVGPATSVNQIGYNIACFYDLTTIDTGLKPEQIDPHLCTHILTGYANIINCSLVDTEQHMNEYPRVMRLKQANPDLKILLMAGGKATSEMVSTQENRAKFINQSLSYLQTHGFDGFDLDWEFPAWGGDPIEDRDLLVEFLKEYRQAMDNHNAIPGNLPQILSMDVAAPLTIMVQSYNIPEIAKYVTFVNIMCYDFHFYLWYFPFTGDNSPLFNRSIEHSLFATMNTAWSANTWFEQGMPKEKINVGIPTYGYSYSLEDPMDHGLDAPATGPGIHSGGLTYSTACQFLADGGTEVFDEESQVPHAYRAYDWISYDNVRSVTAKTNWITENGFAGMMVFELNHDDWKGTCGIDSDFPLVRAIKNAAIAAGRRGN